MRRRLYLLFPLRAQAEAAVDELAGLGIPRRHLHAIADNGAGSEVDIGDLPPATRRQRDDLMVDVPPWQVSPIERAIRRHPPETELGGVGWSSELLRT